MLTISFLLLCYSKKSLKCYYTKEKFEYPMESVKYSKKFLSFLFVKSIVIQIYQENDFCGLINSTYT